MSIETKAAENEFKQIISDLKNYDGDAENDNCARVTEGLLENLKLLHDQRMTSLIAETPKPQMPLIICMDGGIIQQVLSFDAAGAGQHVVVVDADAEGVDVEELTKLGEDEAVVFAIKSDEAAKSDWLTDLTTWVRNYVTG